MTLYKLIRQVSEILTPETNSLYEYLLHTSDDDGGFLRTRWCYWGKPVRDFTVHDMDKVLLCFKHPFHEGDAYYERDGEYIETLVKMQLMYYPEDIEANIEWNRQLNYCFVYLIDLKHKTYTMTEYEPIV